MLMYSYNIYSYIHIFTDTLHTRIVTCLYIYIYTFSYMLHTYVPYIFPPETIEDTIAFYKT